MAVLFHGEPTGRAHGTGSLALVSFQFPGFSAAARTSAVAEDTPDDRSVSAHELLEYQLDHYDKSSLHFPWLLEEKLLSLVSEGDYDSLSGFLNSSPFSNYAVGQIASSPRKQIEYSAVLSVSILARAAIIGGMNPYEAYALNDMYLQKIEKSTSEEQDYKILSAALSNYTKAVADERKIKSQSAHVQKMKDYIARHLNQRFTLTDISANLGVSPTYASALFKKNEQMTITEYTLRHRIEASKSMLTFSSFSIAYISEFFVSIHRAILAWCLNEFAKNPPLLIEPGQSRNHFKKLDFE